MEYSEYESVGMAISVSESATITNNDISFITSRILIYAFLGFISIAGDAECDSSRVEAIRLSINTIKLKLNSNVFDTNTMHNILTY